MRESETIKKTFTCELPGNKGCGSVYHALTLPEFDGYSKLTDVQKKEFNKKILDNHIKSCFRRQDYGKP